MYSSTEVNKFLQQGKYLYEVHNYIRTEWKMFYCAAAEQRLGVNSV